MRRSTCTSGGDVTKQRRRNNTKARIFNKYTSLNREDKVMEAKKSWREHRKSKPTGSEPVNPYKHASAKLKKKEDGGPFQRLRGQK